MTTTHAPANSTPVGARTSSPWPTFALCAIAVYITTLDLSIVNVAFAEIAATFPNTSRAQLSWVVTGYAIVFGSLLLVAGQTADRIGRKRVLLTGVILFLVGSFTCGVAPGLGTLIAGRVVQGIGGALITPASTGLVLGVFGLERRGQVMAWVGGIGALGIASGPTIGAFMIDQLGWRSAFWVNVPICALLCALGIVVLRETEPQRGPLPDVVGAGLFTVGIALLVVGISEGESWGWRGGRIVGVFVVGLAFVAAVVVRARRHVNPALPLVLFRERSFSVANAASFFFGAAFSAMALNNVLFLRTVWQYGVVRAGWFSVVSPLVVAVVAPITGRLVKEHGLRSLWFLGPLLFALSQVLYAVALDANPKPWTIWLPIGVLQGAAIGFTFPVLGAAAVASLPAARLGVGSAVNNTFRQVGAAVGVAMLVAIQSAAGDERGFYRGWWFTGGCSVAVALFGFALARPDANSGLR